MRARKLITFGAAALALAVPPTAAAKTVFHGVHAHRGGPNTGGKAAYPENSLEAFRAAHELGADVIELDVKLTADNVPVVMHDATLDRTTNCDGQVRQRTAADLAANCRIDTVGTEELIKPAAGPGVRIPTLAQVLEWAKARRAKLHVEIKNQPTDSDYDPTPAFAQSVLTVLEASGIDKRRVLIQSFWFPNLDAAKASGFPTALLLLRDFANQGGIEFARTNGYTVVAPQWPTAGDPKQFVDSAHQAGKPVVPWTVDERAEILRVRRVGADAVITNDTALGLQVWYGEACRQAKARENRTLARYNRTLRAYRNARRGTARERKLCKQALSDRRAYLRAKRSRGATCAKVPR